MNVYLEISVDSPRTWKTLREKLQFYAEEADVRLDAGIPLGENPLQPEGVTIKCPEAHAQKLRDIFSKAGLLSRVRLDMELILPQDDPEERKIQEKLYPGGDTSKKPPEPKDREPPSESARLYMNASEYADYMHGLGRRAKTSAG